MPMFFSLLFYIFSTSAQESPKKPEESFIGAGFGFGWIQDYPGAGQGRMRYLVLPTYKSKHITIDRQDGVKGELAEKDRFQFAVSFSFLFPTPSSKIPVRQGMPDLGWTLQLGPELRIQLTKNAFHSMYVRLPLRFVANTDFSHKFDFLDWNFAPSLRNNFYLGEGYGEISTRLELDYASEAFSNLFYGVAPQYATPTRPAYTAKSGLLEYIVGVNYTYYDLFPWMFFIGGNLYLMQNAKNRDSPLLVNPTNYSIIGGIVRYF
ncbi:MAG: MipA/OmpV family protein [Bdellovibrionaceae bacterium]|nr:MipA/OmpV family protein [Pseudobdellovibrionaceae bacterium]